MTGPSRVVTTSCVVQWCDGPAYDGCDRKIEPGTRYLEHTNGAVWMSECLACARRNGRPEVAEPDVAEQPVDLEGIA